MSCRACGNVIKCPHCDVSLSQHQGGRLICHYCGYETEQPKVCPTCGSKYIGGFKAGTQKIEVLHPLPRVDEIAYDVDDDSRAAYFQQVQNGKYMRMALILSLLGIEDPQTGEKILELGES